MLFFFSKKKTFLVNVYWNLLLDSVLHRHPDTVLAHLLTCITQYYCSDRGTTVSTSEAGAIVGATVDWIKSNNTRVIIYTSQTPFPSSHLPLFFPPPYTSLSFPGMKVQDISANHIDRLSTLAHSLYSTNPSGWTKKLAS